MAIVFGLRAPIQEGMRNLDPQGKINPESDVLRNPKDKEGEWKTTTSIKWIMIWSHHV